MDAEFDVELIRGICALAGYEVRKHHSTMTGKVYYDLFSPMGNYLNYHNEEGKVWAFAYKHLMRYGVPHD